MGKDASIQGEFQTLEGADTQTKSNTQQISITNKTGKNSKMKIGISCLSVIVAIISVSVIVVIGVLGNRINSGIVGTWRAE